jgi:hypothetical protein
MYQLINKLYYILMKNYTLIYTLYECYNLLMLCQCVNTFINVLFYLIINTLLVS